MRIQYVLHCIVLKVLYVLINYQKKKINLININVTIYVYLYEARRGNEHFSLLFLYYSIVL